MQNDKFRQRGGKKLPGDMRIIEGNALILLPMSKKDAQGVGSAMSYAERYGLCALLGISSGDDDDGNAAQPQRDAEKRPWRKPQEGRDGPPWSKSSRKREDAKGRALEAAMQYDPEQSDEEAMRRFTECQTLQEFEGFTAWIKKKGMSDGTPPSGTPTSSAGGDSHAPGGAPPSPPGAVALRKSKSGL